MKTLPTFPIAFAALMATHLATAATLSNANIDTRHTHYQLAPGDAVFEGWNGAVATDLQFHGNVGDSGVFGVVGFPPGYTISVTSGSGIAISNLTPADASGVIRYTATVIGPSDQTVRQAWSFTGGVVVDPATGPLATLEFNRSHSGFLRTGGSFVYSIDIGGDWSAAGVAPQHHVLRGFTPAFTVVDDFVYDSVAGRTRFSMRDTTWDNTSVNLDFVLYGAPVPEPASAVLLAAGLGWMLMRRRRDA
jgi:hypothetical protein